MCKIIFKYKVIKVKGVVKFCFKEIFINRDHNFFDHMIRQAILFFFFEQIDPSYN